MKIRIEKEPPKQPSLCIGCVWGKWDGLKQFCPKQACIKVTPKKVLRHG